MEPTIKSIVKSHCHTTQNFGGKKLSRIWQFTTNLPKFFLPAILSYMIKLACCAKQQPTCQCFSAQMFLVSICQSLCFTVSNSIKAFGYYRSQNDNLSWVIFHLFRYMAKLVGQIYSTLLMNESLITLINN